MFDIDAVDTSNCGRSLEMVVDFEQPRCLFASCKDRDALVH
jgi:hypothetical protein